MKAISKMLRIVSTAMLTVMIVLAFLLVGVKFLGFEVYTVLSGSMEPVYHTGSVIYVKDADADKLEEGDIITYSLSSNVTATHRIIELVTEDGDVKFRTKGDANNIADGSLVEKSQVIGKPVFSVPYLGFLAAYLQTKSGRFMAIAVCGLALLLTLIPDLLTDEEEDKKDSRE
ncbi:MAG: signal peptidase I [Oscillospiraceae bacterium]|nr:signal peptidase I [Oscillospiraceae bacterium]